MRRWRRPGVFAVALTVVGVTMFSALGVWQLRRMQEKERLLAAFDTAARPAPVPLAGAVEANAAESFPHVVGPGVFDAERGYLLDERPHDGRFGVDVIAVFHPSGVSSALLVDRGWVPWDHRPETRPVVPPLPQGEVQVSGIYAPFPGAGIALGGDALRGQARWPKLTLRLDHEALAADLGQPVLPRMLLLDPAPDSGFVREWKPNVMPPQRHLAYAVQWFALALAAAVIFVVLHWRNLEDENRG